MQLSDSSLTFSVRRRTPELIAPAAPTPRELKPLSDIDDQEGFRFHVPGIQFYRKDPKMGNRNPASVMRDALAKVLVLYYPFAGRLREGPARMLVVDCTGEGVLFIEAEADVTLKQFGEWLHPPFPCMEELLYNVPGSDAIINSPLILVQVTRLLCGGFIVASRVNHTMSDGQGMVQFLAAWAEIARGAPTPSLLPTWQRELLFARDPPRVTFAHHEYDESDSRDTDLTGRELTHKTFLFGPSEVSALRRLVPEDLKKCSTFEVITASVWRCRTIALQLDPQQEMRLMFPVNARCKFDPPIPVGYYGNCFVLPCVISTAGDLSAKPLSHALQLVMKAKSLVSEEYVRSTADLLVTRGRPRFGLLNSYMTSDVTRAGFNEIDFGWGKATYGGAATGGLDPYPGIFNYYMLLTNDNDEPGIGVPVYLPPPEMERFVQELNNMLKM